MQSGTVFVEASQECRHGKSISFFSLCPTSFTADLCPDSNDHERCVAASQPQLLSLHQARWSEVTLRPVLLRAVWSLNLALQGRRPGNSRPLSMKFATCEIKGDWKFYVETFELRQWYTCNRICHRCNAANVENKGPLFSNFGTAFRQNDTMAFINEVLPDQPSPLVLLSGFHVRWLRWCLMHNCNLGLFQVETAEALLLLAETACLHDPNLTMQGALKQSYKAFKTWCRAEKVSCTVRPWKITQFHLGKDPREPTQHPWINFKAYNARCVLAFVAAAEANCNCCHPVQASIKL